MLSLLCALQVIFVDDDMANISKAHSCCVTVAIQTRSGMNEQHTKHIEEQCMVYPNEQQLQMEHCGADTERFQRMCVHVP